jgi:hypothetical protein
MGRSGGSKLKVQGNSETRGKKEFQKIALAAKESGKEKQSSLSELLASSYAAGLDCGIDQKIIDQINTQLDNVQSEEISDSLEKMLEIFQEQALTKQKFLSLQMKMKTKLLKKAKERLAEPDIDQEEKERMEEIVTNIDTTVHQELLRTNNQYRRFF